VCSSDLTNIKICKLRVDFDTLQFLEDSSLFALKNVKKLVVHFKKRWEVNYPQIIALSIRVLNNQIDYPNEKKKDYPQHLVIDFINYDGDLSRTRDTFRRLPRDLFKKISFKNFPLKQPYQTMFFKIIPHVLETFKISIKSGDLLEEEDYSPLTDDNLIYLITKRNIAFL
jgi:hypothetical protein